MAATVTIIGPPTQLRAILQHPGTTMRRSNQEKNEPFGIFWDTQRLRKCLICKFGHGLSHQLGNQDVDGS